MTTQQGRPDDEPWTLTRAGWPRPVVAGWPVPWVAPAEHLSRTDSPRRDATASGAICQVCGGDYDSAESAYGFFGFTFSGKVATKLDLPFGAYLDELVDADELLTPLDGAIMHWRCAKLASSVCPHIRDRDDLVCLAVPANQGWAREVDRILRPHYAAEYARYAPWPATTAAEPHFEEDS